MIFNEREVLLALVRQTATAAQEAQDPRADRPYHGHDLGVLELSRWMKDRARKRAFGGVHTIQYERVEMNVEVEGRPESLNAVHRTRATIRDAVARRAALVEAEDGPQEDAARCATEGRMSREEVTHYPGEGDDPLADGDSWEDVVHQVRGRFGHAPPPA